jgi:DNA gyrase subunit B
MNPEQLWETTLNPDGRKLLQVTIDDAAASDGIVRTLMGDNVEKRREYIINHANFSAGEDIDGIAVAGGDE